MITDYSESDAFVRKNLDGIDLTRAEARRLFELPLPVVGRIADEVRRQRCGDLVTFVIDRNINYTNRCVSRCAFCAFYARTDGDVYHLTEDDILEKIGESVAVGATQILIQGGFDPAIETAWFEHLFTAIKQRFPTVQLHSLSPPEICFMAQKDGVSVRAMLERLRAAGLDSVPGGGAEILSERVRRKISPNKATSDEWLDVMRTAHDMGMRTTATMMFGHIETDDDIIEHVFKIRDLQKDTGGFTAFIPWTFQPKNTALYKQVKEPVSALRYLRVLAISRIILHPIRNIQASWLTQNFEIDKLALFFGANDFGGTILEENVVTAAGKEHTPARVGEIVAAIQSVGRPAAQRTTYYDLIRRY